MLFMKAAKGGVNRWRGHHISHSFAKHLDLFFLRLPIPRNRSEIAGGSAGKLNSMAQSAIYNPTLEPKSSKNSLMTCGHPLRTRPRTEINPTVERVTSLTLSFSSLPPLRSTRTCIVRGLPREFQPREGSSLSVSRRVSLFRTVRIDHRSVCVFLPRI